MARFLLLTFACGCMLTLPAPARSDERAAALAVIEKAIQAHGGEAALTRAQRTRRNATGTLSQFGDQALPFKDESVFDLPRRFRLALEIGEGQQKLKVLMVGTTARAWESAGGVVRELSQERLAEVREELDLQWLATLVPLKQAATFQLAPAAGTKVHDRPALGVRVSRKDRADVFLYFDRETGLLTKAARQTTVAGLPVQKEYLFQAHQAFSGARLPTRTTELMNGRKFSEVTSCTYTLLDQVEDGLFAKP